MTDIGTETDSAIWMVLEAHRRLKILNPTSPLLKYIRPHEDGQGYDWVKEHYDEHWERYPAPISGDPNRRMNAVALAKYALDMEDEIKRIKDRVAGI